VTVAGTKTNDYDGTETISEEAMEKTYADGTLVGTFHEATIA
jgi:hypothetical protein